MALYSSFAEFIPSFSSTSSIALSCDSSFIALDSHPSSTVTIYNYPYLSLFSFIRIETAAPVSALLFTTPSTLLVACSDLLTLWDVRTASLLHSAVLPSPVLPGITSLKIFESKIFILLTSAALVSLDAASLRRLRPLGHCKSFDKNFLLNDRAVLKIFSPHEAASADEATVEASYTTAATKTATEICVIGNLYALYSPARLLVYKESELLHIVDAAMSLDELDRKFRGFFCNSETLQLWRDDGVKIEVDVSSGTRNISTDCDMSNIKAIIAENILVDDKGHVTIGNRKLFPVMKKRQAQVLMSTRNSEILLIKFPHVENLFTGEVWKLEVPEFFGQITAVASVADGTLLAVGSSTGQVAVFDAREISAVFAASTPAAVAALVATTPMEIGVVDCTNALGIFSLKGERRSKIRPAVDLVRNFWEVDKGVVRFPALRYSEEWDPREGAFMKSAFGRDRLVGLRKKLHVLGISVHNEGVELSMETTRFSKIPEKFYDRLLSLPIGLRTHLGYALRFNWRAEQPREATLPRIPQGARRRSASADFPLYQSKALRVKKSVWHSWLGFLLDARASVAEFADDRERAINLGPIFAERCFSMQTALEGLRSPFTLNRVIAYNHTRYLLKEYEVGEKKSFPGDSRNLIYYIAMTTELDFQSPLFPAVVDPLLRLTIDKDPTAEKLFCELFHLINRRLTQEERQRLVTSLRSHKKQTLNVPNPLLMVAESDVDAFIHEFVASEIRKGHFDTFSLLVALVRRSPRTILKKMGSFCHGVMRCVEILGERKKTSRELTLLLNVLVEKFPMVAFHKPSQRLLAGTVDGEIVQVEFKHFHERTIAKISDSISALAVSGDGEFVASLGGKKISVFRLSHHTSFFNFFKSSHAPHTPLMEIPAPTSSHPLGLGTPLDAVRLFWPSRDLLVLIDEDGTEHKFTISLTS